MTQQFILCCVLCLKGAGVELKKLLAEETVCFYVSPFLRSKQTFDRIRKAFHDEQVWQEVEEEELQEVK